MLLFCYYACRLTGNLPAEGGAAWRKVLRRPWVRGQARWVGLGMSSGSAPPVSIGLPVYNGEAYLATAIDTLLAQDFGDFELVIADNASTDRTEEICREVLRRDPRVSYHRSDRNRGAAWNFSRLLDLTRGGYFRWATHDDACEPTYLSRCLAVLEDRPDVSLCFSRSLHIDSDDQTLGTETIPTPATQRRAGARARSFLLSRDFPSAAPFGLMRREQALRTDLIRPYKGSDRTFLLQMALQGSFHEIPEPLYRSRRHSGRSVRLPEEQRLTWWDGGPVGRRFFPRWRLLLGYVEAAATSPVFRLTRLETLSYLVPWAFRNVSPLGRELGRRVQRGAVERATRPSVDRQV